jgi:RimJ/RimL family protein N-acetyltransferase
VGYATEAALALRDWLAANGVASFFAHIHPDHTASNGVAIGLRLANTGELDDEGELIWA